MEAFSAIADPVRRRIVESLATGEKTAGQLGEGFAISQPAVSRHLRVLREAGLIEARAQSQRRLYRLNTAPLAEVESWLARCRQLWERGVDSLKTRVAGGEGDGLLRISRRYPGRVSLDLASWERGRWPRPPGAPLPVDQTAA